MQKTDHHDPDHYEPDHYEPGPIGYRTQAWHTTVNAAVYALTRGRRLRLEGRRHGPGGRRWHNWTFGESQEADIVVPRSEAEIIAAIRTSDQLRVVGSGHSFNSAIRSATLLSLDDYAGPIDDFDHPPEHCSEPGVTYVRVRAGTRVRDISKLLLDRGLAIQALPSHDSQSIAGVLSTDVHGTGRDMGFVSSSVVGLRIIDGLGDVHDVWRGEDLFAAAIGGIGAVGVITEVSVRCVPAFNIEQATSWAKVDEARAKWRDWLEEHHHMSFYVFPHADRLQLHTWNPTDAPVTDGAARKEYRHIAWAALAAAWFGDLFAKFGKLKWGANLGPRLQRPSTLVMPSAAGFNRSIYPMHQELEFAAPLDQAWELIDRMNEIYIELAGVRRLPFMLVEVRFTPANGTYGMISPSSGPEPRVWLCLVVNQSPGWREYFDAVEAELLRNGDDARPHLGKYCQAYSADHLADLHGPAFDRFVELRQRHDPHERFANDFTRRLFGAETVHRMLPESGAPQSTDELRYNQVRQKSVHNAYKRTEGLIDQLLYWRIRSLEVDLHVTNQVGQGIDAGDWAIYHHKYDPHSAVHRMSQVLEMLAGFHRAVPDHEVITVFVDMKDPFPADQDDDHSGAKLDDLIRSHLGDAVYRPSQMLNRAPGAKSLQTAVDPDGGHGWPTLAELRGKFVFCITGSPEYVEHYTDGSLTDGERMLFVSMPTSAPEDIPGDPDRIFFNINAEKNLHLVDLAVSRGFVARAYYVDDIERWGSAVEVGVHHLATDMVNECLDAWSTTRNGLGFPFTPVSGLTGARRELWDAAVEAGEPIAVWSRSDALAHRRGKDHFGFAHAVFEGADADRTHEFLVAGPHSHVDGDIAGGLMLRSGTDPGDAFFSLARRGPRRDLEVFYRTARGGRLWQQTPDFGSVGIFGRDINLDTISFLRLEVTGHGTRVRAEASHDGDTWRSVAEVEFEVPLTHQGLAVSSGSERDGVKYLFVPTGPTIVPELTSTVVGGSDAGRDRDVWIDLTGERRWRTNATDSRWADI